MTEQGNSSHINHDYGTRFEGLRIEISRSENELLSYIQLFTRSKLSCR